MTTENNFKYLQGPSDDQIRDRIKKANVSILQFERYHGISEGTITKVMMGHRKLPSKFWHIFLEDAGKSTGKKTPRKPPTHKPENASNPSSQVVEKFKF